MATVYTSRFTTGALFSGQGASVTVPAGRVWVLRDISVSGATIDAQISVAGVGAVTALGGGGGESSENFHWQGRWVAYGGEVVQVFSAGADPVSYQITGYDFTA